MYPSREVNLEHTAIFQHIAEAININIAETNSQLAYYATIHFIDALEECDVGAMMFQNQERMIGRIVITDDTISTLRFRLHTAAGPVLWAEHKYLLSDPDSIQNIITHAKRLFSVYWDTNGVPHAP